MSRQITVWRKSEERYNLDCLTPTFKLRCTSIMVWGAFTAIHKLPLIAMPLDRRTAIDFVEIVCDGVLGPFLNAQGDARRLVLMVLLSIGVRLQQLGEQITTLRNLYGQQTRPI